MAFEPKLLIADPDRNVIRMFATTFYQWRIDACARAVDVLRLAYSSDPFGAVVLEQDLPDLEGLALAHEFARHSAGTRRADRPLHNEAWKPP